MSLRSDLKTLYCLVLKPVRGESHSQRMESFYSGQAQAYDGFRRGLLHGREELYARLEAPPGGVWVELGCGTGANLECLGPRIAGLGAVYAVDLSTSMLRVARDRFQKNGWSNVEAVEGDATRFRPLAGPADVVTFSYSLTMIPDWFAAVENAFDMLKPGGLLGVVDFYVARKHPAAGARRHSWLTRSFWPVWFAINNVFPSPDHVPFFQWRFETVHLSEHRGTVHYLPLARAPYYLYIGRKPVPP